jgi:putative flippase GtrA
LGGIGVLSGYLFFLFFTYFIKLWFIFPIIIGEVVNYIISFFVHKYWTFGDKEKKRTTKEMSYYSLVALGYFLINMGLMYLSKELEIEDWISKGSSILILALPNYWATKGVFSMENKKMAKWMARKIISRMEGSLFLGYRKDLLRKLKNRSKIIDIENLKRAFDSEKGIIYSEISRKETPEIEKMIISYLKKLL